MKKLVVLTKSLPDYTTGGNGNILYHILKYLPKKFSHVTIVILKYNNDKINTKFIKDFPNIKFDLKNYLISDLKKNDIYFSKNIFTRSFESILDLYFYKEIIKKNENLIAESDKILSFGYEWALSLDKQNKNKHYCILNDPPEKVFFERFKENYKSINLILFKLRIFLFDLSQKIFLPRVNRYTRLGTFPYQHFKEYSKYLTNIDFLPYFTKKNKFFKRNLKKKQINLIHIGSLTSTASKIMLNNFFQKLIKLNIFDKEINLYIIGRSNQKKQINLKKNIKINFLGHGDQKKIDKIIKKIDFGFCPMNYGLGIRTRILTLISYGLPVIVDDLSLSGFDNTLQRDGVFLNIDEIHSFEKNFKKIFSNNKIYNDLRKKSFGIWKKKFNPEKNIRKINSIIFS